MDTMTARAIPPVIQTVRGLPLFGSLFEFRARRLSLQLRIREECGDIGRFKMGPVGVYAISSAELAQELLVDRSADFKKSRGLSIFARPLLGNGLLTSEADVHHRQRKLIAPAFQHKRVANYAEVMARFGEEAAARLDDGAVINLSEEMMRLTLAIVGKTLFDADVEKDAPQVGEALTVGMKWVIDSVSSALPLPLGVPTPRNLRARRALARLDEVVYRIIRERRAAGGDRGDLLSMLLMAQNEDDKSGMTDRQVRDEAMTLFIAGHETTANALAWTFYLLARHPDVQARVRDEAERVLGGRTPRFEDLQALPYALQVFKESMRLYPPAYMVGRTALRDVRLGEHTIAAGAHVMVNIYAMHRRADYFPDPERFDPERFTPEAEKRLARSAYLPFGGGPRICIGNHFALMEGQILLATLAQRVAFEPLTDGPVEPEPLITLRPRGGLPMKVVRRDRLN